MPLTHRTRNLFDPNSKVPFKLSRARLENFIKCPRCFYLDRRLGIDRPKMPGFTLNSAVDALLKKEFDDYRAKGEPHPLMKAHGVDAVPFQHNDLDIWRANFKGLTYHHHPTNLIITGAIDDLWVTPPPCHPEPFAACHPERSEGSRRLEGKLREGSQLIVVDYKATSKDGEVSLDDDWKDSYKRQMEIYQWILRGMGYDVQDTGYFVYANGRKDTMFSLSQPCHCEAPKGPRQSSVQPTLGQLQFNIQLLPYAGHADWVEAAIIDAHRSLTANTIPEAHSDCEFCDYRRLMREVEG